MAEEPKGKNYSYVIVINNYTEDEITKFRELTAVRYSVYALEVGDSGTPHLQGYVYFENQRSFSAIKKIFPRAHIEKPEGTPEQNRQYIVGPYTKGEKHKPFNPLAIEKGEIPKSKNVNLWEDIKNDITGGMNWEQICLKYPEYAIKYIGGLKNYYNEFRPKYVPQLPEKLYEWQNKLLEIANGEKHDREIYWYYETKGNTGKTTMARYLASKKWQVYNNGKTADIALAWNGENVVFDYSRSQMEHINYEVLEMIKNGQIFSGKYQSASKLYEPPHVICFANQKPDRSKLSADRWRIFRIENGSQIEEYDNDLDE